jgi:hypothetical protein
MDVLRHNSIHTPLDEIALTCDNKEGKQLLP